MTAVLKSKKTSFVNILKSIIFFFLKINYFNMKLYLLSIVILSQIIKIVGDHTLAFDVEPSLLKKEKGNVGFLCIKET